MSPMHCKRIRELLLCWLMCWMFSSPQPAQALDSSPLRIASFNIQVFGQTKISNPSTLEILTRILSRYDLVFIQEIRDSENTAIYELLRQLQGSVAGTSKDYQVSVSERLGRTTSKEQYGLIYDARRVEVLNTYVYDDERDAFEREPMVSRIRSAGLELTLIGIHVTPRDVIGELTALGEVYRDATQRFQSRDVLLMGDLNADCGYYDARRGFQYFDDTASLLLPDGLDTTIAQGQCAYDRLLGFGAVPRLVQGSGVFRFSEAFGLAPESAKLISDHFPVEVSLSRTGESHNANVEVKTEPLPSKPSRAPVIVTPLEPNDGLAPPTRQPQPVAYCGRENYWTSKNYCYGYFESGRRRVANTCCPAL